MEKDAVNNQTTKPIYLVLHLFEFGCSNFQGSKDVPFSINNNADEARIIRTKNCFLIFHTVLHFSLSMFIFTNMLIGHFVISLHSEWYLLKKYSSYSKKYFSLYIWNTIYKKKHITYFKKHFSLFIQNDICKRNIWIYWNHT